MENEIHSFLNEFEVHDGNFHNMGLAEIREAMETEPPEDASDSHSSSTMEAEPPEDAFASLSSTAMEAGGSIESADENESPATTITVNRRRAVQRQPFRWKREPFRNIITLPSANVPALPPSGPKEPIEYFTRFCSDEMIELIEYQSNLYATRKNEGFLVFEMMFLNPSSSSSSSSDDYSSSDEFEDAMAGFFDRNRAKNSVYFEENVPRYDDADFVAHFRVSRTLVSDITERYERSAYFSPCVGKYGKISAVKQVHIFLWFAGHETAGFVDVADRFGITLSSLFRVVRRLTLFLSGVSPEIVRWPNDDQKQESESWFRCKGFPGVIGSIDGTHIRIDRPRQDPDSYYNRKKYFSIRLQVVCDHQKRIISLFAGFPGSVHDARVFRSSPLGQHLQERCGDFILLGDSAYPCSRNLVTPFRSTGQETRQQRQFNRLLSSCRVVAEHCIGLLKQKFRQLYHVKIRNIIRTVHFIRACCVLHNLALSEEFPQEDTPLENPPDVMAQAAVNEEEEEADLPEGVAYRQYLMASLLG